MGGGDPLRSLPGEELSREEVLEGSGSLALKSRDQGGEDMGCQKETKKELSKAFRTSHEAMDG